MRWQTLKLWSTSEIWRNWQHNASGGCAAIAPGFVATELITSMKQTVLDVITSRIPLGRLSEPEEIARAAVEIFENDYLTGRVVEVDGGLRL